MTVYELERICYVRQPDIDYPLIVIWGRDENGNLQRFVQPYRPHFWADRVVDEKYVYKVENDIGLDGKPVKHIYLKLPPDETLMGVMNKMRTENSYESHVLFPIRFLIDKGIKSGFDENLNPVEIKWSKRRVIYLDIEVAIPPTAEITTVPNYEIVSISWYDNYMNKIYACIWRDDLTPRLERRKTTVKHKFGSDEFEILVWKFKSERDMLTFFINYVDQNDPDILTGWNLSGGYVYGRWRTGFDVPYLLRRMERLNIDASKLSPVRVVLAEESLIKGREVVDLMTYFMILQKPTGDLPKWSLAYVAERFLGIKSEEKHPFSEEKWKENIDEILKVNVLDVIKTVLIDKYLQVLEYFDVRRKIVGCTWSQLQFPVQMAAILAMRLRDKPIPDRWITEQYDSYQAAYVKEPRPGVHKGVALYDVKMAYPTAVVIFNMSPETLTDNGNIEIALYKDGNVIKKKIGFRRDVEGLLPKVIKTLMTLREHYRSLMKKATTKEEKDRLFIYDRSFKFMICSMYGVEGNPVFPLYHPYVAAATTAVVREMLQYLESFLYNKFGYEVLYADTDSLYIKVPSWQIAQGLESVINKAVENYLKTKYDVEGSFKIEFATYYKTVIFRKRAEGEEGAKKSLAGLTEWKDGQPFQTVEIIGSVGRETYYAPLSVKLQMEVLNMLLNERPVEEVIKLIKEVIDKFRFYDLEQIALPRAMGQPMDEYKSVPPWVRGIRYSMRYFGHPHPSTESKINYVYVSRVVGMPRTDVVGWTDISYIPKDKIIVDKEVMVDKVVRAPLEPWLRAAGINWDTYFRRYKKKQKKIKEVKLLPGQQKLGTWIKAR
jgi:DNA polymerase elongation subunit (family B)